MAMDSYRRHICRRGLAFAILVGSGSLVMLAQKPAEPQKAPAIRVVVNMVVVNASVTDSSGRRLSDLASSDFEVLEDGIKQEVKFFQSTESPFHVALLIDTSGSTSSKLKLLRKAAERFLNQLTPQDRVAIVEVADRVQLIQSFTADRRALARRLDRLGSAVRSGTLLHDAVVDVLENVFQRVEGRKAVVFLTDGQDTGSKARIGDVRQAVYQSDAVLYGLLVDTEQDVEKVLKTAADRYSKMALVLEAISERSVPEVKQAAGFLLDRLPASIEVCVVEHRSARRASLLQPYTTDREVLEKAIERARVRAGVAGAPSTWRASGNSVLLTDNPRNLPSRIQDDILREAAVFLIDQADRAKWQAILGEFAGNIPDPLLAREGLVGLSESYRQARNDIGSFCSHSGGKSFDLRRIEDLDRFYDAVADELRHTYSLGYYSRATPGKLHSLAVVFAGGGKVEIRARRGFVLP